MSKIGEAERKAQNRVIAMLCGGTSGSIGGLGWRYLGDWQKREGTANIESSLLRPCLEARGYAPDIVTKSIALLKRTAFIEGDKLYEANKAFYDALRYGLTVEPDGGGAPITVQFITWDDPGANHFGIAEEVAVPGKNPKAWNKRPDIVFYVNGIALGVLELKRSTVAVAEGIRQNLDNQKPEFIRHFFTTVQIVFSGNDSEGLRYAPVLTPQPYWLAWKEQSPIENRLERDIGQMLQPERFLEIIHDFTVFDAGIRKACRSNQYFAVKAAQERIATREGGIIWQTQGSGKSLIMVMLARWIRENIHDARVLIITDRKELDSQISEVVFGGVGEKVRRAQSGADLMAALADESERLVCSLVHKFGRKEEGEIESIINHIRSNAIGAPKGNFFVFIDECHRTQAGKLARSMRQILPDAMFIGFTGTPLLRSDKETSIETFGPFIGTPYRFDEAVEDGVILDLRYEARDIDQRVSQPDRIDQWFESRTEGLTPVARAAIKQRWGTLQTVLSSRERLGQIVADIIFDMESLPRLKSDRGNAMLVAGSIPEACRLFEMFQGTHLRDKCAIITSFTRQASNLTGEETGLGETERQYVHKIYDDLLTRRRQTEEEYEEEALGLFRNEPGRMKLLIVVSKLLTGFDAPTATYIYIDKQMRDHGLFQAICRVNRIDTDDKDHGYIIDYKDLFRNIEGAVEDYTSEAFDGFEKSDVAGLITNRASKAADDFEAAREAWLALMDKVEQPKEDTQIYAYFSSPDPRVDPDGDEKARRRQSLYKLTGSFASTFGHLAENPAASSVGADEIDMYRAEVAHALSVRDAVRNHSGDAVDMKQYEPTMRYLIDTFIKADGSTKVSALEDMSLVDLVIAKGAKVEDSFPGRLRGKRDNAAEAIENNVRRLIIEETPINPRFYEKISQLLIDLVAQRKKEAISYADYLTRIAEMARKVKLGHDDIYPDLVSSPGKKALYDNLDGDEDLVLKVDAIVRETAQDGFRSSARKQRLIRNRLAEVLTDEDEIDRILDIVMAQDEY